VKYLSVCSGIEAASVAWHPLGWKPLAFSEIEPFPRAVLAHHYPHVPCHGDFTKLRDEAWIADADVLVGGTPCQAFSVAGLRNSLSDERGNLSLEFVRLADAIDNVRIGSGRKPAIIVWENVPGVLSVKDNAFGCFLSALAGDDTPYVPPRGKWTNAGVVAGPKRTIAWRVLDAQYFGLAQRRRRVFVVASAREGFDPAAVLLEFEGVRRDSPPRRETGQVAPAIPSRSTAGGGLGTDFDCDGGVIKAVAVEEVAETLIASDYKGPGHNRDHNFVAHSLKAEGFDANEDGTGRGTPLVPVAFHPTQDPISSTDGSTHALGCGSKGGQASVAVAVSLRGRDGGGTAYGISGELVVDDDHIGPLDTTSGRGQGMVAEASQGGGDKPHVLAAIGVGADCYNGDLTGDVAMTLKAAGGEGNPATNLPTLVTNMAVRRLTARECERLQGFPDDYTLIPWKKKPASECPDGPRYKALGNSMAVPCMRWIGTRIAQALEGER